MTRGLDRCNSTLDSTASNWIIPLNILSIKDEGFLYKQMAGISLRTEFWNLSPLQAVLIAGFNITYKQLLIIFALRMVLENNSSNVICEYFISLIMESFFFFWYTQ